MKPRLAHVFDKAENGHYVEPSWCSERLFEVESFGPRGSLVLDPACGWGTIVTSARAAGYTAIGADIVKRRGYEQHDFLKDDMPNLLQRNQFSVVCNPPFGNIEQFCRHAMEIGARKVAMICPLRRLPAARWLQDMPLRTVYAMTPRPSMPPAAWIAAGNKPGGGTQDFCWLVFDPGYTKGTPQLAWLHREAQ